MSEPDHENVERLIKALFAAVDGQESIDAVFAVANLARATLSSISTDELTYTKNIIKFANDLNEEGFIPHSAPRVFSEEEPS